MNDDDPSDVAHEQFAAAVLGTHPLGRPIGGTPDTIKAVPRDAVWDHYREHYGPRDARGHRRGRRRPRRAVRAGARRGAGRRAGGPRPASAPLPRRGSDGTVASCLPAAGAEVVVRRTTEQANVVARRPRADGDRPAPLRALGAQRGARRRHVVAPVPGDPREARPGLLDVLLRLRARRHRHLRAVRRAARRPRSTRSPRCSSRSGSGSRTTVCDPGELERSIGQLSGGLVLGMEDTGSRMGRLGKSELVHGELLGLGRDARGDPRRHRRGRPRPGRRAARDAALPGPGRSGRHGSAA